MASIMWFNHIKLYLELRRTRTIRRFDWLLQAPNGGSGGIVDRYKPTSLTVTVPSIQKPDQTQISSQIAAHETRMSLIGLDLTLKSEIKQQESNSVNLFGGKVNNSEGIRSLDCNHDSSQRHAAKI